MAFQDCFVWIIGISLPDISCLAYPIKENHCAHEKYLIKILRHCFKQIIVLTYLIGAFLFEAKDVVLICGSNIYCYTNIVKEYLKNTSNIHRLRKNTWRITELCYNNIICSR